MYHIASWNILRAESFEDYRIVWEKFTIGYFRVKIVCGKIFSCLRVSDKNFLNNEVF